MRITPEQRYRLELAKNNAPTTSSFVWIVPLFLAACCLLKTEAGQEVAQMADRQPTTTSVESTETHFVKQQYSASRNGNAEFARYQNADPVCSGETLCILGWRL